jgi:hypothetical protein
MGIVPAASMTDPRRCEQCGAPLVRRPGEQAALFAVRRFCCRTCATYAVRSLRNWERPPVDNGPRTCAWCGDLYYRPVNISSGNFARRQYCSAQCAKDAAQNRPPACDCGQPATERVPVTQLSSAGLPYTVTLHLCAECAALERNTEPTPRRNVASRLP